MRRLDGPPPGSEPHIRGATCALFAAAVSVGCSSPAPSPNSFTNVYSKVLGTTTCTNDYCHYNLVPTKWSGLDLSNQTRAYWSLVNHLPEGATCNAPTYGLRVLPYNPADSILYQKVSETSPPCGVQMPADPTQLFPLGEANSEPVFSGTAISSEDQQLIYNWIEEGAQNN